MKKGIIKWLVAYVFVAVAVIGLHDCVYAKDYYYCIKNGQFGRSNAEYFEGSIKWANEIKVMHKGNINRHEIEDGEYALVYETKNSNGDTFKFIKLVTKEQSD